MEHISDRRNAIYADKMSWDMMEWNSWDNTGWDCLWDNIDHGIGQRDQI